MAFGDLFKSRAAREREVSREKRRQTRQGNRKVQKTLHELGDKVKKIRLKRDADWAKAKEYLRGGQKAQAENLLKSCRAKELLASKLERRVDFWESRQTRMEATQSDAVMADAMRDLATLSNIDPDNIEESMLAMEETFDDQTEVDSIIEREHEKDTEEVSLQETETVPSLKDMVSELESEVAVEIGADSLAPEEATPQTVEGTTNKEKISTLRDRLKEVLEDEE
ncbi:MAG: hypothetical protein NTV86_00130 [Planctomycetota bacterium]|nr:hypothetical protein [Planctomycetota bacterium]